MPNPRNRIKLTGDTHLPDVGDEGAGYEDVLAFEPALDSEVGSRQAGDSSAPAVRGGDYLEAVRAQVRQRPVAALAGAFVLGALLARG
jgi:hypothetical protein